MPYESVERLPLHLGKTRDGSDFILPLRGLRRHMLALGGTGSGKTILCKAVVEEALRYRLPVTAIDLQGDLLGFGLPSTAVPDGAVSPSGGTRRALARQLDVKVWTPGSRMGIPLSFTPDMAVSSGLAPEERLRAIGATAADIAGMVGERSEATIAGIYSILDHADRSGHGCESLDALSAYLKDPPAALASELEVLLPKRPRQRLVQAIAVKQSGVNRLFYRLGKPIDLYELFGCRYPGPAFENRVRLSIIYLAHLAPEVQQRFLSLLFSAMYRWMLSLDGSLCGLLYIDEIAPFCPPVTKPPAKAGLMKLLRQARKYGLCCLLATQSPGDVDYKALGQIGTLALGRLPEDAGLARVASMLRSVPGMDAGKTLRTLARRRPGEFLVINPDHLDGPTAMKSRWIATEHRVVAEREIKNLVADEDRERLGATQGLAPLKEVA